MDLMFWGDGVETLSSYFHALAEGGTVTMPLEKQEWGDIYGSVTDTFGVSWGFNLADPADQG